MRKVKDAKYEDAIDWVCQVKGSNNFDFGLSATAKSLHEYLRYMPEAQFISDIFIVSIEQVAEDLIQNNKDYE